MELALWILVGFTFINILILWGIWNTTSATMYNTNALVDYEKDKR